MLAGTNDLGQSAPTRNVGDYGHQLGNNGTIKYWAARNAFSDFAAGLPLGADTADDEPDEDTGDDTQDDSTDDPVDDSLDSPGDDVDETTDDTDVPATDPAPTTPADRLDCGEAPCGVLGMMALPLMFVGLVTMKRSVRRVRR